MKETNRKSDIQDVRSIVTADAPYAGNVMRIPQEIQQKARQLCWKYNMTDPSDGKAQATILKELLGSWSENVAIMPHAHFDYGINTHFAGGHFTFINFDYKGYDGVYLGRYAQWFVGIFFCLGFFGFCGVIAVLIARHYGT